MYAIELNLLEDICVHLVFYVNLLEPVAIDLLYLGQIQLLSLLIKIDGKTE